MTFRIGLDIGGTKVAGALYDGNGTECALTKVPTPATYEGLLSVCHSVIAELERKNRAAFVGACAPYADAHTSSNMPYLVGKDLRKDLEQACARPVAVGNDADCAALVEALEGAGKGYRSVFGLIIGTGVGGGFVLDGKLVKGVNGTCGEIGHLPLPYYEEGDGERVLCGCGQKGCIEQMIAGAAIARLFQVHTGRQADAKAIGAMAQKGDGDALKVLDRYFTTVAKAMVAVLHAFDPEIITVSGGLSILPKLYEEVPKRWGRYAIRKSPRTAFAPARFGAMAGLRGAAWLDRNI